MHDDIFTMVLFNDKISYLWYGSLLLHMNIMIQSTNCRHRWEDSIFYRGLWWFDWQINCTCIVSPHRRWRGWSWQQFFVLFHLRCWISFIVIDLYDQNLTNICIFLISFIYFIGISFEFLVIVRRLFGRRFFY
jgi:hypothetical protein